MLFVELALIRWIGSNVIYLSFFTNFVLLGSFLGIGIGFLRAKARVDLFPWSPVALAFLIGFVRVFPVTVECASGQVIYFGCTPSGLPIWVTLPAVFAAVALTMATIRAGRRARLRRLRTAGGVPPRRSRQPRRHRRLHGALVPRRAAARVGRRRRDRADRAVEAVAAAAASRRDRGAAADARRGIVRAGRQLVAVLQDQHLSAERAHATEINVNGIPHQIIMPIAERRATEPLYFVPYRRLHHNPLRRVLIVGAGNGSDAAIALASGAKHVDGVEIDPRIYGLGRLMNPDRPYDDPRVPRRDRRRPRLPPALDAEVRPDSLRAARLARARLGTVVAPPRELSLHARSDAVRARASRARRRLRHVQLLPRGLAERSSRAHARSRSRTAIRRATT